MATTLESAITAAKNTGHALPFPDTRRGPDAPNFGVYGGIKEEYLFDDVRRGTYKGIGRNQHSFRPRPAGLVEQSLFTTAETNRKGRLRNIVEAPKNSVLEFPAAASTNPVHEYNLFEGPPTALEEARAKGAKTWEAPESNRKLPKPAVAKPSQPLTPMPDIVPSTVFKPASLNIFTPGNLYSGLNAVSNAAEMVKQGTNFSKEYWQSMSKAKNNAMSVEDFFNQQTSINEKFETGFSNRIAQAGENKDALRQMYKDAAQKMESITQGNINSYIDSRIGTQAEVAKYQNMMKDFGNASAADRMAMAESGLAKEAIENGIMTKTGALGETNLTEYVRNKQFGLEENAGLRAEVEKYASGRQKALQSGFAAETATDRALGKMTQSVKNSEKNIAKDIGNSLGHMGKYGAVAAGALATAGLVFAMSDSRGSQTNAQLYGQAPAYSN